MVRNIRWIFSAALAMGVASDSVCDARASARQGAKAPSAAPPERTGIAVGKKAPAFVLKDQAGAERSLEEMTKKGKLAVVLHRSASW